ncbi:MAG TPA: elongation factor P [Spirochaetota bacterium]|jgi:elongation factor P|nr:elongation factor P [Spirochaetota bacterium]OQA99888.1 MAG: Elongation factor P [Spirochaetes bacterium ADurb.Bin218]HOK02181.1 elongation factor P [Spirochaetota bacterium]HOK93740.1 elongation factor P [Spirochaetota bacterium]HON17259.1 elongation factor P [Spirochaetota bacterium]
MISVNDFKRGVIIKLDGELYSVLEYQHVKPARGAAFVRSKVKNLKKGSIVEKTFRGGEKVEDVKIVKKPMQYLYEEGDSLVFMDTETYEQESIPKKAIGDALKFIKEQDVVDIAMYEGEAITVEPPQTVVLKVVYAEPGLKGDTATNVLKPVKVETGAEVKVPLFVNEGDLIKINTETGEYLERVKQ